jgi:glucose 1-dehydrogenase
MPSTDNPTEPLGLPATRTLRRQRAGQTTSSTVTRRRRGETMGLEGRRAIVTGASSGIGRAIAIRLATAGAAVAVNHFSSHERRDAESVVAEINDLGGTALAVHADVGDELQVVQMVRQIVSELGGLEILVNNAGIETQAQILELSLELWERVLRTNLTGAFLCLREAGKVMVGRGRGVIVNISSVHEHDPWPGFAHYCASKAGLKLLMQTAARELAPRGIRVVNVAPGAIETPINQLVLEDPEALRALVDAIPLGRLGRPEEIAAAVEWLISDEASYVTGTTFVIDGGASQGQ